MIKTIFLLLLFIAKTVITFLGVIVAQSRMPTISACDHIMNYCTQPTKHVRMIEAIFYYYYSLSISLSHLEAMCYPASHANYQCM